MTLKELIDCTSQPHIILTLHEEIGDEVIPRMDYLLVERLGYTPVDSVYRISDAYLFAEVVDYDILQAGKDDIPRLIATVTKKINQQIFLDDVKKEMGLAETFGPDDQSTLTLENFLNLCTNVVANIIINLSGSGRVYEGSVGELKKDREESLMLRASVKEFFIANGSEEPVLVIKIGG